MMKYTLFSLLASLTLLGCKKEEPSESKSESEAEAPAAADEAIEPTPEVVVQRRPVVFKSWDVDATFDMEEEEEEEEEEDEGEEEDTTAKRAEGDEGKFGDPDLDPMVESKMVGKINPKQVGLQGLMATERSSRLQNWQAEAPKAAERDFPLTVTNLKTIQLNARYHRIDAHATNRYGDLRMVYSPSDAQVTVTQVKYKETLNEFVTRTTKAGPDKRQEVARTELRKFSRLTSALDSSQVVSEQRINNLALTSRSNPKDREDPTRPKHCTDDPEDYCTFEYEVRVAKPDFRPVEVLLTSAFASDPPGATSKPATRRVSFYQAGPGIWEAAWPVVVLKPTPALLQKQSVPSKQNPVGGTP